MLNDKHDPIHDCDCQACALAERNKLRARVLELQAVHEDASGAVLQERERCADLCDELAEAAQKEMLLQPTNSAARDRYIARREALRSAAVEMRLGPNVANKLEARQGRSA
jgi:hypothetical protein